MNETLNTWIELKNINLDKEKINIFCNPGKFFQKYIEKLTDETVKKTIKIEIYLILRKVSGITHNTDDDIEIAKRCKDDLDFVLVCKQFYVYTLDILNHILAEQSDAILDTYNEKKIDKKCMEEYIVAYKKSEEMFLEEKKQLEQRILELEELIEIINNDTDLPDDE